MNRITIFFFISVLLIIGFLFFNCTYYKLLSKSEWKELGGKGEGAEGDIIPVGTIVAFYSIDIPDGWTLCD